MKAFNPASFKKIAAQTGIDVEIVAAAAVSIQHDIVINRDRTNGTCLDRLTATVKRGAANRPSLRLKYPELSAKHEGLARNADMASRKLERELPGTILITSEILRLFTKGWLQGSPFSYAAESGAR